MAGTRSILSLVSLILLAGGIVLEFFVILSGAINSTPVNKVYFLQTTTHGITSTAKPNLPSVVRWTFFALCGVVGGHNGKCEAVHAALPFNPPGVENFHTRTNVPAEFFGTKKFYYLSRFMFAFFLIALFFAVVSLLLSVFALCARLGAYLAGLTTALALFFQILAAALMTSWAVIGKQAFSKSGQTAKLGTYGFAFTWAALACWLISTILFCAGGGADKSGGGSGSGKKGYFGRKRSTKSRGSFVDSESGRRVKDEYD